MTQPNSVQEFNIIVNTPGKLVVVYFGSPTCGHCVAIKDDLQTIVKKYSDVIFIKIEPNELNLEIFKKYNITGTPSFIVFNDGMLIDTITGAKLKQLENLLQ